MDIYLALSYTQQISKKPNGILPESKYKSGGIKAPSQSGPDNILITIYYTKGKITNRLHSLRIWISIV